MVNKYYSIVSMQKRLLAAVLAVTFVFGLLVVRLFFIQIIDGKKLQSKAVDQWTRDLPIQAVRGGILDTNGEVLASGYTTYSVYVRPRAVTDPDKTARALTQALDITYEDALAKTTRKGVSEVTVQRAVPKSLTDLIRASGADGIYISEDYTRYYPNGEFLTQVLGFTNIDGVGQSGLESKYEQYLKGVNGMSLTQADIGGRELNSNTDTYIPSIPGCDVILTVDKNIQSLAESAVRDAQKTHGSKSASAIVMDVETGGIVAMATSPGFDLNNPPRNDIASLNALTKNTLITDVFEPGSTFKIFTLASAIDGGLTNLNERFFDPGYRIIDGQRIRCWKTAGHGSQTLQEAVNNSCNSVFVDLAVRMGKDKFYNAISSYGFGKKTGIDFAAESSGIVMAKSTAKTVDLARMGFGQAIALTPLQLITGVSAVVNGGKLVTPHFVQEIKSYDGKTVFIQNTEEKGRVVSAETSKTMRQILATAVSSGSGKKAGVAGYSIGGKTGTAQKYENGVIARGKYVSSFVGFAPADNPKYAVLVIVDEPSGYLYYGSLVAAPYASFIFGGIFNYMNIAPANLAQDTEKLRPKVVMPSLIGLSYTQAGEALIKAGLQYEVAGESGTVINQVPAAGTLVAENDVTLIRLANDYE